MAFTAKDVMRLREMTGVGMMDCKKALTMRRVILTAQLNCFVKRVWLPLQKKQAVLRQKALYMRMLLIMATLQW